MTIQALFIMANQALQKSISQIADDQWELAMPPGMSIKPGTLQDAVCWHTYDDAWVPDVLAGKTKEEVGDVYEHLRTTAENIKETYDKYNQRANDAVRDFTDLDRTTHLSYGDFKARDYLQHVTCFRAFRSYDIAVLIGADTTMPDEFVEALLAEYTPVIENYRQMGVFPPALEIAETASPQAKLLAMVGRK